MPSPKSDNLCNLEFIMEKWRAGARCHSSRQLSRDRILSKHRGFSHTAHHPKVLRDMSAHVVAAELGDFLSEHLRQHRLRLAAVAPENSCHGLFQADNDIFFDPAGVARCRDTRELNQFLNKRLELSVQLLNLLIPESNELQKQLYCPRVVRLKQATRSPEEAAYRNELERLQKRVLKEMRFLTNHLVGFYFCLLQGSDTHWDLVLQRDGFLTALSLLCQFGGGSPPGAETLDTDSVHDTQESHRNVPYTSNFDEVMRCKPFWRSTLWPAALLAQAVAHMDRRGHVWSSHAARCLLMAVFNRRGRNQHPTCLSAFELLNKPEGDNFSVSSWLTVAETNEFRSYVTNSAAPSLTAVEVLALRVVFTMATCGESESLQYLNSRNTLTLLSAKVHHLWRSSQQTRENSELELHGLATEEVHCVCDDTMALHAWVLSAVSRTRTDVTQMEESTACTFVLPVFCLIEHLLQPNWLSVLSAVALLKFLTDVTAKVPQLVTLICEVGQERAVPVLKKCFVWSGSIQAQATQLTANLLHTPHTHNQCTEHVDGESSKCMVLNPELRQQLSSVSYTTAGS